MLILSLMFNVGAELILYINQLLLLVCGTVYILLNMTYELYYLYNIIITYIRRME